MSLPTGTISFVLTDVQGSTRRWEADAAGMRAAMAQHDAIAHGIVERHEGHVVKARGEGDSLFLVFDRATNAVSAALALQLAFADHTWPTVEPIKVRMAVGTGEAAVRDGDYYGTYVNRVARLRAVGHGGQVLISTSTRDLVCDALPDGVTLVDLGEQQLADLTRPERVYQLAGAGLPADFPPLKSLNVLPNNLPRQTTSFIGREKEIADLKKLLSDNALVTVMGSGGVGKSRICFQVAADLLSQFPDGVWATELASVTGPEQAQSRIASSVGATGSDAVESLVATIKSKSMLLVIDNCEHVIDGVRALIAAMLARCPNSRILATSRERLDVPGEHVFRLPSLAAPDPAHLPPLAAIAEFDAIRLFTQRAQQLDGAFAITASNAAAVAGICSRLDGIPLAIELAASRTKVLPPSEILKRLNQRFKLLTGGSRLALPRQQTLLATIEWGYDLLTPSEQTVLQRLSVFVEGWTMEAAEQVCSGDGIDDFEVLDLLTSLIDKSLVLPYDDRYGKPRYRLLETVRQFAGNRLEAGGQRQAVRERHAAYFEGTALGIWERTNAGEPGMADMHTSRSEHGNLVAAIEYLCDPRVCIDATRACTIFMGTVPSFVVGSINPADVFNFIRTRVPLGNTNACAKALGFFASNLAHTTGALISTLDVADEAVSMARKVGDPYALFDALTARAEVLYKLGRSSDADAMLADASAVAETIETPKYRLGVKGTIASRYWQLGRYREALSILLETIEIATSIRLRYSLAHDLRDAGRAFYLLGDYREARQLFDESASHFDACDMFPYILLRHSADLSCAMGQYESAWRDLLVDFEHTSARDGMGLLLAASYESAAYLHASEAAFDAAAKLLGAATALRELSDEPRVIPEQQEYDKIVDLIVAGIGADACNRLIAEGEKLTDDQANALVVRMAVPVAEELMAFEDV